MSFTLNHLIVHEINKEPQSSESNLVHSSKTVNVDDYATSLIEQVEKKFNKLTLTRGKFEDDETNRFPIFFKEYVGNQTEPVFINFSKESAIDLNSTMRNVNLAKGGYLIYADYTCEKNYFTVFILRNIESYFFKRETDNFKINPTFHLNTNDLAMACRIDKDKINGEERYLSFISKNNDVVSNYFVKWVSISDKIDDTTDTQRLVDIIEKIDPKPIDPDTEEEYTTDDFKKAIFKYIDEDLNKKVDLHELGRRFYENEDKFTDCAEEHGIIINTVFKANPRILKSLIKVKIKSSDRFEVGFPYNFLHDSSKVSLNLERKMVTLKSLDLVQKLIQLRDRGQ